MKQEGTIHAHTKQNNPFLKWHDSLVGETNDTHKKWLITSYYKTKNPKSAHQCTTHTEVEHLEGNEKGIRSRWERRAMKKEVWKKYRSWSGQGKKQDIPGRHKRPTKAKHKKAKIVLFPLNIISTDYLAHVHFISTSSVFEKLFNTKV